MKNRILSVLIILALALCPAAFAEEAAQTPEERIAELEQLLAEKDARIADLEAQLAAAGTNGFAPTDAAAEFEGGTVTIEEARAEYEYRAYYYSAFGLESEEYDDIIKQEVLASLVEDAILRAKATEFGLYDLTEEDMKEIEQQAADSFEENVAYYMSFRMVEGKTDEEIRQETIEYLAGEEYTLESVKETLINQTWRDRLYEYVTQNIELTDETFRQHYEGELASAELTYAADPTEYEYARMDGTVVLWNPEGYRRVKAILIGFDDAELDKYTQLTIDLENAADDETRSRLLDEIDALYVSLQPIVDEVEGRIQAGEDFMLLVDEYSADENTIVEPTRSEGYYVSADSQVYTDAFREAAMALENIGDVSAPVKTDLGVYILKYESDVAPGAVAFEDVQEALRETALSAIADKTYNETVEKWLEEANIVYHPDRF